MAKKAYLWEKGDSGKVQCKLCRFGCNIDDGKLGICSVRKNIAGTLYSLNYNKLVAAAVDPIEKKPLYHFLPGTKSYSIAAAGCNFHCSFCQNWQISQKGNVENEFGSPVESRQVIKAALNSNCQSISYTYTEPTVFMETAADIAVGAKEAGLKNIFVSNGYMSREAVDFAAAWLDAINIDLKAFSQKFYREMTGGSLEKVLDTLRYIKQTTDIHLEITTLIIPQKNDSEDEINSLARFIAEEISPDTPWHISAFYPAYKCSKPPTEPAIIRKACQIASSCGLSYVYAGNIAANNDTLCPECGKVLIKRRLYTVEMFTETPNCPACNTPIYLNLN